jgi:hypothetical protein
VFLTKQLIAKDVYMQRDSIFNASRDLWLLTTSLQSLSAIRRASHRQNSYDPHSPPVAVKHRAVEPVNKVKILPVHIQTRLQ